MFVGQWQQATGAVCGGLHVAEQKFRIATFLFAPLVLVGLGCASNSTTSCSLIEPQRTHGNAQAQGSSSYHAQPSGRVLGVTHERGSDPAECGPLVFTTGALSSNPPPPPSIDDSEESLVESVRRYAAEVPSRVSTFPCGTI